MGDIRLFVIDNSVITLAGIKKEIEDSPNIILVGEATNYIDGIKQARSVQPDVILIDLLASETDHVNTVKVLKEQNCKTSIIVFSQLLEDKQILGALQAGARGFLYKDVEPKALTDAIKDICCGLCPIDPRVMPIIIDFISSQTRESLHLNEFAERHATSVEELTKRETEVLLLVAQGLSNKEIAKQLVITESTVRSHVSLVFAKLGVSNRTQATIYAYQNGFIKLEPISKFD